uniref:Exportin 5 n=1 Tax=Takifugu rubripes TaxID=31033 RepID=A0A674PBU9_TAKRU
AMSGEVASLCEQLMAAVNVTMDPETSHIYRLEALKFCEEFKENNSLCVPCGLQLADKAQPAVVRHFGLQILEHVIKFRWNDMQQQEKVHLKECAMQLLSNGTLSILEEESHIKDVLSRIIVEMIKREWPQQWPDMLKEMEVLSSQGETQTELVMLILLRLAEDVIFFQTLPAQRRRDIQQKLTQNMDSIFRFMMTILRANVEELRKLVSEHSFCLAFCRVAVSTLNTLAGYIDWVSLSYISSKYSEILEVLCLLLNEPELQLEAAECLVIAVRRKGKLEDRKPIMLLFDDVAIDCILSAAQSADGLVVEQRYIFLKRLCQVLCALGGQLCALVGSDAKVSIPANLSKYLEALLAFTTHSSQFLKSSTLITWANLFRHETLSREEAVVQMAVRYLRACMTNFVKTGFPSKNDSPSCAYSRVDFDNDSDFNSFFNTFRAQQGDLVRGACRIAPHEAFQIASEWLRYEVTTPIDTGGSKSQTAEGMCSFLSPSVLQWEAVTTFMDCTKFPIDQSMELLQAMLNYETSDPLIMSCVLTNISTLFPFATRRQQFLPRVFYKVILNTYRCQQVTRAVAFARGHVRPYFDMFYNHVKNLFASDATLSQMEKCALMESLILISNQFKDFAKQKAFLDELMSSVVVQWASDEMKNVLCEPAAFLSYAGADQVVTESGEGTDTAGLNRARVTMFAMVKRSRWPADQEEAKAGGFVVDYTPTGAPIHRNPGAALFLSFLPNLLALIRTHNNLFLPENMARLSETYGGTHDLMDFDKKTVLVFPQQPLENCDVPVYKTNLERMQGFFTTVYDYSFQILGNAGPCLQQEFYTVEGLARELASSAFVNLDHVPDHRLRLMIHILYIFTVCSTELSVLCPLLGPMFAYMLQRLNVKWQVINQRTSVNEVTKEMLDEYLVRLVTRELLDFVCNKFPLTDEDMVMDSEQVAPAGHSTENLTELGKCLLKHENIYMTLLTLSFTSLSWKDTTNCHRTASMVCWALLQQVEAVTWFFTSVLRGLQFHGQHETCNATLSYLAMLIYDNLRPRFVELRAVMAQIPNISVEALDQYDHRLIDPNAQKVGEKRRKDQFKKLIAGTVEKALCQQFRKEVHVRNLPSLFKKQKTDKDIMSSENNVLMLAQVPHPLLPRGDIG